MGEPGPTCEAAMNLEPPLLAAKVILETLARHRVRYVVIGALGAALHGSPLRTSDVDICPDPRPDNLTNLSRALEELGAKEWDPHKGEAVAREWDAGMLRRDDMWILVTNHGDLDLVFEPAGTKGYRDLAKEAVELDIDGLRVDVASLDDIIRSKEATGRPRDREQLPTLRRLQETLREE